MEPTPPAPPGVIAYLAVAGGEAAIAFYRKAFGAEEVLRHVAPDGKRLLHARLMINGGMVMLSDDFPEHGGSRVPPAGQPHGVMMAMQVPEVDAVFNQAVSAGAEAVMPPTDMFWGERYAQLRDPFGHEWALNGPLAAKDD